MVKIRDYRLGLIHYGIMLIVFAYIGVYIMWLKRGYYASSSYVGSTALKIKGMSYSLDAQGGLVPWSSEDLVQPAIEKDAAFITTSVITTANQTRGVCPGPFYNCTRDSDCNRPPLFTGECFQGACNLWQWCPAENISAAEIAYPPSYESDILSANTLTVWMKATMAFPSLRPGKMYSTVNQNDPVTDPSNPQRNLFSVGDLLTMTNTQYADIMDRGCILLVKLNWECYLDSDAPCFPTVTATRLDNRTVNTGFNFRMPQYYRSPDGTLTRDLMKYTGVRMFFSRCVVSSIAWCCVCIAEAGVRVEALPVVSHILSLSLLCVCLDEWMKRGTVRVWAT